jgi:hypothetical protein
MNTRRAAQRQKLQEERCYVSCSPLSKLSTLNARHFIVLKLVISNERSWASRHGPEQGDLGVGEWVLTRVY